MTDLGERITAFERKYLARLCHWSALVSEDELDKLLLTIAEMEQESEDISKQFASKQLPSKDRPLFEQSWLPILARINCLIPSINRQLEGLKTEARIGLGEVGRGQMGLRGYRQTLPVQKTFFESEG